MLPPSYLPVQARGWVGVYDASGAFKPGWPKQPFTNEIRSLAAGDRYIQQHADREGPGDLAAGAAALVQL